MKTKFLFGLASVSLAASLNLHAAGFADSVISYHSGTGFVAGYTNAAAILGEPSRITPGQFGGPVDPFNSPYLSEQVLSIGAGGSVTVHMSSPIQNSPANPFGLDFIIFGNAGFVITNGDYSGGGITDGSLYGGSTATTRIWVSDDNVHFYLLNPSLAPTVDNLFPTDGSGDFSKPVDPNLSGSNFADKDLAGIRSLYAGSGGGTGFDLAWAQDENGQAVSLPSAQYVRVEVLNGAAEIDGIAVVPEPGTFALGVAGAALLLASKSRKRARSKGSQ